MKKILLVFLFVFLLCNNLEAKKTNSNVPDKFINDLSSFIGSFSNGAPLRINDNMYLNSVELVSNKKSYQLMLTYLFTDESLYDESYYSSTDDLSYGLMLTLIKNLKYDIDYYLRYNLDLNVKILSSSKKLLFSKVISVDKYLEYYNYNKNTNIYSATTHDMSYMHQLVDYLNRDNPTEIDDGMTLENIALEDRTWVYNIYLRNDVSVAYVLALLDDEEKTKSDIKESLIQEKRMMFTNQIIKELRDLGITFEYRYFDQDTKKLILTINFSMEDI